MAKPSGSRAGPSGERLDLIERLNLAGRELSTATVMFHSALAARRGLAASDEKALDILLRNGPLTHAQLVEHTSLAPASVSDLIDRLEGKGYVHRARHPDDRRRVLVTADAERIFADVTPLFEDWVRALGELYADYTDAELSTIQDFLIKAAERQHAAAERLVQADP